MERRIANPDMRATALELTKKSNLQHYYLRDGINPRNGVFAFMAIAVTLLAAVGAGAFGYLVAAKGNPPYLDLAWPYALMGGGLVGAFVGWLAFGKLVDASAPEYEAQMREDDRPRGRSFTPSANNPRRSISLSEDDKRLLQTFASRYEVIGSMAINRWEGGNSPFDWWDNKTAAIKRVHSLVERMGYGARTGINSGLELTADGLGKIADWQAGIFEEIPPTPEAA